MKLNPFAVMAEQFDGTGLVFNPESNAAVSLNKTGVYLWNRLKEGATEAEMAAGLVEKYDGVTEEKASSDVAAFLEELRSRSLLSED
ncbi:MAG: PqqD family protein [Lentisphaeria bacterium]|nr:PqqD family protein [Lentisphaeria bacterium]